MGVGGLALSTAAASWMNALALFIALRRRLGALGGRRIVVTIFKSGIGCAGMALFCIWITHAAARVPLIFRLTAAIGGGSVVYLLLAKLVRMEEWDPFWAQLSRRRAA